MGPAGLVLSLVMKIPADNSRISICCRRDLGGTKIIKLKKQTIHIFKMFNQKFDRYLLKNFREESQKDLETSETVMLRTVKFYLLGNFSTVSNNPEDLNNARNIWTKSTAS